MILSSGIDEQVKSNPYDSVNCSFALIPLALAGDKPGNEIQSPMAIVILGGLFSSTLLNAFVVPAVYLLINQNQKR
jgi:Cu/Ag efflux pump CusA